MQRVPATESQGRIHTSSATVTVLPEVDEVDVQIDDRDLDIDVFRASGPGGQGVNTTDSAVRITHRPSGLVVSMQDERSQLQNRARAMVVLRARLFELAEQERNAELSAERRSQTGGGGRSEKIRTYNYKENRVTDHRIGFTVYRLAAILAGDLQVVIDALAAEERARLLAEGAEGATRLTTIGARGANCWPRPRPGSGIGPQARWLCEVAASAADGAEFMTMLDEPADRADGRPPRCDDRPGSPPANRSSTCSASGRSGTSSWRSTGGC